MPVTHKGFGGSNGGGLDASAVQALIDSSIDLIEGQFAGAADTFAALPVTTSDGSAVDNGDFAILRLDDGSNDKGVYVYDGSAYVFRSSVGNSGSNLRSEYSQTLPLALNRTDSEGQRLYEFLLEDVAKNKAIVKITDSTATLLSVKSVVSSLTTVAVVGEGVSSVFSNDADILPSGLFEVQMASSANMLLQTLSEEDQDVVRDYAPNDAHKNGQLVTASALGANVIMRAISDIPNVPVLGSNSIDEYVLYGQESIGSWAADEHTIKGLKVKQDGVIYECLITGATGSTTLEDDLLNGIFQVYLEQEEGLRGAPVADNSELSALDARDYERRKVLSDGKEYVFEFGALSGTIQDDALTGFWQEQVAEGLATNYIDSSSGATVETLTPSTSSGVVRLFTNQNVDNSATLAVQSGETLNGVIDGSFAFSNYSVGTQFRADQVSGGWVVSVVGSSSNTEFEVVSASISDITGVSGSTFVTGAVTSGEARIDAVRYYDSGDFRYIQVDISDFDDTEVIYQIQPSIMPLGGEVLSAYQLGRSGSGDGGNYITGSVSGQPNQFFYDRNNSIDVLHQITIEAKVTNPSAQGSVVLAGMVESEQLSYLIAKPSSDQGIDALDASDNMPFIDTVSSSGAGIVNNGDGSFTLSSGRYRLSSALAFTSDGGEITNPNFRWFNITSGAFFGSQSFYVDFTGDSSPKPCDSVAILDVSVDTDIALRPSVNVDNSISLFQQESHISIEQIASSSIVLPQSIEVDEQASSGYLDIGNTRIQWGRATTDVTGAVTLTFPQPMADTNYSFNATAANGNNTAMMYLNDTNSGLQVIARDTAGGASNTSFSWQAIGIKP